MSAPCCMHCGAELTFLAGDLGRTECEDCLHAKNLDETLKELRDRIATLEAEAVQRPVEICRVCGTRQPRERR